MIRLRSMTGLGIAVGALTLGGVALAKSNAVPGPKVDPQMQKVLDAHKALSTKPPHLMTPAQARKSPTAKDAVEAVMKKQGKPVTPEVVASVQDRSIDGPVKPIDIRVYTPEGSGPFPGIVYYHGGGFVFADLDVYDASPRALANQAKAVVVSVHYRQAPEDPFPASHDDAQAAFKWVVANAAELRIAPDRIAVAGESAGGNLATTVAIRQKNDGGTLPVFQLLIYPFISADVSTPSHVRNGKGNYFLGNDLIAWFWKHEFGNDWKDEKRPLALPINADRDALKGLPPAMVIVASLDPLLDEGIAYAKKLDEAGVTTKVVTYEGVTHEFFGMAPVLDTAKRAQNEAGEALRKALSADAPKPVRGLEREEEMRP